MSIRIAKKEDALQIAKIRCYSFNMGNIAKENSKEIDNFEQIIVNEDENVITSCVTIVPFEMLFEKNFYKMGGIAGVASLPQYRGKGAIRNIMCGCLQKMKDDGQIFSALGPFKYSFYRNFGYEWGFTFDLVGIPINDLKAFESTTKYEVMDDSNQDFVDIRNQYINKINGPVKWDNDILNNKWSKIKNQNNHCVVAYDETSKAIATAIYKIENKKLLCEEFYYINIKGRDALLHFFYRHSAQVEEVEITSPTCENFRNILENPRIRYWQWPNMMFRVVDVKKALELKHYDFDLSLRIKIIDKYAPWNEKTFTIETNNGVSNISESSDNFDVEMSIQRFSQLYIGFIDGQEAIDNEFAKFANKASQKIFIKVFKKHPTMLWQYF